MHTLVLSFLKKGVDPARISSLIDSYESVSKVIKYALTIKRRERKCLIVAAAIPGTPAMLSRKRIRFEEIDDISLHDLKSFTNV